MEKETLPIKRSVKYRETITIKVEQELKKEYLFLSERSVDVPELLRAAIRKEIREAVESISSEKAA